MINYDALPMEKTQYTSSQLRAKAEQERRKREIENKWPDCHVMGPNGLPAPFHLGQQLAYDSQLRFIAMIAGSQGGKTGFAPWWLKREIETCGGGDYLAVTANYGLFKLRLLPAMRDVFENINQIGRYWSGDKIMELRDPKTNKFLAKRVDDKMWGRIILRSADAVGGLEAATAKAALLDEAGQDQFTIDAWRAILRRLAINRGRALITTTLYNLGWLIQQVVERAENGGEVDITRIGDAEITHTVNVKAGIDLIQYDSILNPTYPMEEFEEARASMPDDEFQMFYRGLRATLRGLIYDVLDKQRHTCARFPIPKDWRRFLGVDPSGSHRCGVFFAEEPKSNRLYGYREYYAEKLTAKEHADKMLEGEPGRPRAYGGAPSEDQQRRELAAGGLPVGKPIVADLWVGIGRVYGALKRDEMVFFNDLTNTLDQFGRYRRKRDKEGNPTDEIENKSAFHYLDAVRGVISTVRPGPKRKAKVHIVELPL